MKFLSSYIGWNSSFNAHEISVYSFVYGVQQQTEPGPYKKRCAHTEEEEEEE